MKTIKQLTTGLLLISSLICVGYTAEGDFPHEKGISSRSSSSTKLTIQESLRSLIDREEEELRVQVLSNLADDNTFLPDYHVEEKYKKIIFDRYCELKSKINELLSDAVSDELLTTDEAYTLAIFKPKYKWENKGLRKSNYVDFSQKAHIEVPVIPTNSHKETEYNPAEFDGLPILTLQDFNQLSLEERESFQIAFSRFDDTSESSTKKD